MAEDDEDALAYCMAYNDDAKENVILDIIDGVGRR